MRKKCDLIVANNVSKKDRGFNSDYNEVSILDNNGNIRLIKKNKKSIIASKIADIILDKLLMNDRNLIKRLSKNIPLPKYETSGSSGMDLAANLEKSVKIEPGKVSVIPTGISLSIPQNFEIQIRPRSGLAAKNQISVLNTLELLMLTTEEK